MAPGLIKRLTGYTGAQLFRGGSRRVGERLGIQWLIYNPVIMHYYHQVAVVDAPAVVAALDAVFPAARRWIDVGAGSGAFSAEAKRRGKVVVACEQSPVGRLYARFQGVDSRPFDLSREPHAQLDASFDLALCFEVAEHLPPPLGDRLVKYLVGLAPRIVFTAAHPGQGGYAHLNEQPREYWISRFYTAGAVLSPVLTDAVVTAFVERAVSASWLIDNSMVFVARDGPASVSSQGA
jgi:SAM-dependent methyltransferase